MRATGSKSAVVLTQEALWGVLNPYTPPVIGLNYRSINLGGSKNTIQSETLNQYRAIVGLGDGNKAVQGNIVTDLLPEGMEVLLRHLLGDIAVVTTGSDPYTHVLKGTADTLEGLSIQKSFTNIDKHFIYKGCRINSMAIDIVQEGFHGVTWDIIGQTEATSASESIAVASAVYPTLNGFTGYECSIEISTDSGSSWGTVGNATSGSLNIANNIETDGYVIGSDERASAEFGIRNVSGGFNIFFEDLTLYDLYTAGTECGLRYVFTNGTQTMTFEFPIVKLGGESPNIDSPTGTDLAFTFQGRYDTSEGTDVKVTIVNTLSSIPNPVTS